MLRTTSGKFIAVLSLLAIVTVAMGGAGYAGVKIGTAQLKDGAVSTAKLKNNAVTSDKIKANTIVGDDVLEISLKTVPSAASINGMKPDYIAYRSTSASPVIVYNDVGLKITASCVGGNDLNLTATTVKQDSSIYSQLVDTDTGDTYTADLESQLFDTSSSFNLLAGAPASAEDPAMVTFVYDALDVSVVTGTLATDLAGPTCNVTGTLMRY